jgi:ATP-dependent RNA helicase RhlB
MTFEELGATKELVDRLSQKGILNPTGIQSEVFNPVLLNSSILGMSKTGTGKTLAYVLPLMHRLMTSPRLGNDPIRYLVLVPTRELASQVQQTIDLLTARSDWGVVVVGGESEETQMRQSQTAKFMIATPGRLLDLLKRRLVDLSQVETVVFDEADRLLDMGFVDDMREIMRIVTKPNQQLLFFSATTHFGIDEMAYEFRVQDLLRIGKESDELTVEGLDHRVAFVGEQEKFHALVAFLHSKKGERGIVFSNYRDKAHEIAGRLRKGGCPAEVLTAQLTQAARSRIMEQFRSGVVQVLIASDLAARGIDVSDLDFVVNVDLPDDSATYVHRVGRTARAGKKGIALSFVGFEDSFRLEKLEKFLGHAIERYRFESTQLTGPLLRFAEYPVGETSHQERQARIAEPPSRPVTPKVQSSKVAVRPPSAHTPTKHQSTTPIKGWRSFFSPVVRFLKSLFSSSKSPIPDAKHRIEVESEKRPPRHFSRKGGSSHSRRNDSRPSNHQGGRPHRGSRNFSGPRGRGRPSPGGSSSSSSSN